MALPAPLPKTETEINPAQDLLTRHGGKRFRTILADPPWQFQNRTGKNARTLAPGRRQVNFLATQKREHSRKPDEFYDIVESCSPGPYLELFARGPREGWDVWGNQADEYYPTWPTYSNHSQVERPGSVTPMEQMALLAK